MEFLDGTTASVPPRRARKKTENALEQSPEFRQLLAALPDLRPGKILGLSFEPADATALGMKWPARAAVDYLRRLIRATGATGIYRVRKFSQGEKWFVTVEAVDARPQEREQPQATMQSKTA